MTGPIDKTALIEILERIDQHLEAPQKLCLIGGAALILMGSPGRQTEDIDVWRRASRLTDPVSARAAIAAGVGYDPKEDEPEGVYLQIINPGIIKLPTQTAEKWPDGSETIVLWEGQHLQVVSPSAQILAAAKIIRATEVDLADIAYLIASSRIGPEEIREALQHFPDPQDRADGTENIELVNVFIQRTARSRNDREIES